MSDQVAAGWYQDPAGSGQLRWWDGQQWTDHLRPVPTADTPGGPTPARRRRRPLVAGIMILLVAGAGVAVVALGDRSGSSGADPGRLPDLSSEPEVAWSLETHELFEPLVAALDEERDLATWIPSSADARAGGREHLREHGHLEVLSAGDDRVVVLPRLHDLARRVHGLDTADGTVAWTSTPLVEAAGGSPTWSWIDCRGGDTWLYCLTMVYNDDHLADPASRLRVLDPADGEVVATAELPRDVASAYVVDVVDDDLLGVIGAPNDAMRLVRWDTAGVVVWEHEFDGGWWPEVRVVGDLALATGGTDGEWFARAVDVATGEAVEDLAPEQTGSPPYRHYRAWGGELMQVETDQPGAGNLVVSVLDADRGERWWRSERGQAVAAGGGVVVDEGAPVLIMDGSTLRAREPADGEERWTAHLRSGSPRVRLAARDRVLVVDGGDLVALDATDGTEHWRRAHGAGSEWPTLAFGTRTVYLVEDGRRIRTWELTDGEPGWSWSASGASPATGQLRDLGGRLAFVRPDLIEGLG